MLVLTEMPTSVPVLPWALHEREHQIPCPSTPAAAPQLAPGQRIEVLWQVATNSEESSLQWWGACLVAPVESSSADCPVWTVQYDAMHGFDTETTDVLFKSAGKLQHIAGEESPLQWRLEGQETENSDSEGEEDAVVGIDALRMDQEQLERELGASLDDIALQHLRDNFPLEQQQRLAAGFRTLADHWVSRLRELTRANGDGAPCTITLSDVESIMRELHSKS